MKKIIYLIALILMLALVACGCSGNKDSNRNDAANSGQETANRSENNGNEVDISVYKKPADTVSVDLTKDDPSNDEMRFVFDDNGKVTQCYYNIGDQQVYVNYTYKDGAVQIYAFMGEVVAADELIEISEYDAEKGFTVIDGYYFKGVSAR